MRRTQRQSGHSFHPWGRKQVRVPSCSWVCFVLVEEVAGAEEVKGAGAAGEEEVVVL